ncbi:MAG: hypothetical protein R2711_11155 [Acidimicrobiales bacterium]
MQGYISGLLRPAAQFRLFVLHTAWSIDEHNDYRKVRKDIAAVKVLMPGRAPRHRPRGPCRCTAPQLQQRCRSRMMLAAAVLDLADGPTEVHRPSPGRCCATTTGRATTCGPPVTGPSPLPLCGRSTPRRSSTR